MRTRELRRVLLVGDPSAAPLAELAAALEQAGVAAAQLANASALDAGAWLRRARSCDALVLSQHAWAHPHLQRQLHLARLTGCMAVRWWTGADVQACLHSARVADSARALDRAVDLNLALAPHLVEALAGLGIHAERAPPVCALPVAPAVLRELPRAVLLELPPRRQAHLELCAVGPAIEAHPELEFLLAGDASHALRGHRNLTWLGPVDDLDTVWPRVGALLRITAYDGLPCTVLDALVHRRYVIYSWPLEGCWLASSAHEISAQLARFKAQDTPHDTGPAAAHAIGADPGRRYREMLARHLRTRRQAPATAALHVLRCQGAVVGERLRAPARLAALGAGELSRLRVRARFPRAAERSLERWSAGGELPAAAYTDLLRYFALGWITYRDVHGSGAAYPGLPGWSGANVDRLEAFARLMPLFGAWCAGGREAEITLHGGRRLSLPQEFERGLLAGTDPGAPGYWGGMPGTSNQRIVEAADVALTLWLFRDSVWAGLSRRQRAAVVAWLALLDGRPGLDNNWHLFFVLVDRVLSALGYPGRIRGARARFERIKQFHLGDGWFRDGPGGRVDFYNAWGFHYALTWIDRIDPAWDPEFIHRVQNDFLAGYKYLIGPVGLPMLGRSIHYRIATPAPLVAGHERHAAVVDAAQARRALDAVWSYFMRHGALRHGTVSQGYFAPDHRLIEPYAGPASPLWSLRSLIMAFQFPPEHVFWHSAGGRLPVECADFQVRLEGPQWLVHGLHARRAITIEVLDNAPDAAPRLDSCSRLQMLRRAARGEPRPSHAEARYERRFYRSDTPFWD